VKRRIRGVQSEQPEKRAVSFLTAQLQILDTTLKNLM